MKKRLTHNIGLKIVAALFAAFLWLIVVNIDNPIATRDFKNIEVTVQHDEVIKNAGKTYQATAETKVVTVTVRAKRSVLDKIRAENIKAVADMRQLNLKTLVPIKVYITGFEGRYESAYTNPANLQINIEASASKNFPVSVTTVGTLRDGYAIGELTPDPGKIEIGGSESIVGRIDRVVAKVDVSGLSEDTSLPAELILYDADNNVLDQKTLSTNLGSQDVSVQVTLLNTKTVPLKFSDSAIDTLKGYSVSEVSFEPNAVLVAGEKDVIDKLDQIDIPAVALKQESISEKTEVVVDITPYLPENVELVDATANSVAVTITVVEAGTKTLAMPVQSIAVYKLTSGLKVDYGMTQSVELTFQGTQEALDALTLEKVTASVELGAYTKEEEAEVEVPVQVNVTQAGITVVPANVKVTIKKK